MFSRGEIARSLQGAWLLFLQRREGLQWFDLSVDGFWRSFRVIFLLLPLYGVLFLAQKRLLLENPDHVPDRFSDDAYWFAKLASIGIDWITLPIVLALLAGAIGISGGYVGLIVVRNWSSILVALAQAAVALLYLLGIIPSGILFLCWMAVFFIALWYWFNIVRFTLDSTFGLTLGIVVLDVVMSLLIGQLADGLWAG